MIEATNITNTDYLTGFQYKNAVLQFFPHAEGYVNATEEMVFMGGTSYRFNYVYNYTDHLGNIRLSYSLDPSTNVLKIIEENHYYPFGLKHTGYNSDQMMYVKEASVLKIKPKPPLFISSYDKKFNGKSWETDLSLNIYDFHARGYMPDIVRTFQHDPLAEKFYDFSPHSFLNNNPLSFIDPTGMMASPIYDENGKFLGTDSEGFKGEALFMNRKVYNILMNDKNNLDSNGNLLHSQAKWTGENLDKVIGNGTKNDFTKSEINMVNNAITHIVSQMDGVNTGDLHNGKTSSSYFQDLEGIKMDSNIGINEGEAGYRKAYQKDMPNGKTIINFSLQEFTGDVGLTVENVQNTMSHEYGGHYIGGVPGGENQTHLNLLYAQKTHPTWQGTTPGFKRDVNNVINMYKRILGQ